MTDHIKVEESYVAALIKNAAWDAARVGLNEKWGDKKGDEGAGKDKKDKPDYTTDARKGDKGKGKDKDDKPDYTTDQRKGDKSKTHPGKKDFEEMKEEVEEHVCPLCESTLEEALTDEQVFEHVSQIKDALQSIEEEDAGAHEPGDDDDRISYLKADPKAPASDTSKNAKVMKKVDALKNATKG